MVDNLAGCLCAGQNRSRKDRVLRDRCACRARDTAGTLPEQVERRGQVRHHLQLSNRYAVKRTALAMPKYDLSFFNGLGGFTHDGRNTS